MDMETKSRALIVETLQPTIHKVHSQQDEISTVQRTIQQMSAQIKELEYTVFKRGGQRLSVFEEIDDRITKIEKARAESEASILWEIEAFKNVNSS